MRVATLDQICDGRTSIAVTPSSKGLPPYTGPPICYRNNLSSADLARLAPPDLKPESNSASVGVEGPNNALINKLLESLNALKCQEAPNNGKDALYVSPSTISTGATAVPSSPTEYDFSPSGPLSRQVSTETLTAAVHQLSLSQQQLCSPMAHKPQSAAASHYVSWDAPLGIATPPLPATHPAAAAAFSTQLSFYQQQATASQNGFCAPQTHHHCQNYTFNHQNIPVGCQKYPFLQAKGYLGANFHPKQDLFVMARQPSPVLDECLVGVNGAYQSYCRQFINEELNAAALSMLANVKAAQLADPPAISRLIGKRYFCSLKEVSKVVTSSRILLIAPDVFPSVTAHIKPLRLLQMVMDAADAAGVPYVFCLSRRGIGQVFGRDKSMSIVAVMHIDGVEDEYMTLLNQAALGRELYALHRGTNTHRTAGSFGRY